MQTPQEPGQTITAAGPLTSVSDYLEAARDRIPAEYFDSMFGVEGDGITRTDASNRAALSAIGFRPRVLVDVSEVTLATTVLGQPIDLPVLLAPVGDMTRIHPDAELGAVRAAGEAGTVMILSLAASISVDEVIAAAQRPLWFQLYVLRDRGATRQLVEHAEALGCAAIVVTVDNPGIIQRDISPGRRQAWGTIGRLELGDKLEGSGLLLESVDPTLSWKDIDWLRSLTEVPLVIKGIQTGEDAALCGTHGAAGLVLSNHGGQALADTVGTVTRLPEIVEAAAGVEVYLDGGIRQGGDILKALALGARAVLIGRAQYWGLAVGGQAGVAGVLEILARELRSAMKFCGLSDVALASPVLVEIADGRSPKVDRL
jgi:4-hydroxymandelate oxidase